VSCVLTAPKGRACPARPALHAPNCPQNRDQHHWADERRDDRADQPTGADANEAERPSADKGADHARRSCRRPLTCPATHPRDRSIASRITEWSTAEQRNDAADVDSPRRAAVQRPPRHDRTPLVVYVLTTMSCGHTQIPWPSAPDAIRATPPRSPRGANTSRCKPDSGMPRPDSGRGARQNRASAANGERKHGRLLAPVMPYEWFHENVGGRRFCGRPLSEESSSGSARSETEPKFPLQVPTTD
jgi:hypothetical protein